jgi:prepilin-type N-terminal cleavage/methylation domain-containing protein
MNSKGFTLIELIVGSIIILVAISALFTGISYVRLTMNKTFVKERAYEELKNYTDFWKSRVALNRWSGAVGVDITDSRIDLIVNDRQSIKANLKRKATLKTDNHPFQYYTLNTSIVWNDLSNHSHEMKFEVNQIVYGK